MYATGSDGVPPIIVVYTERRGIEMKVEHEGDNNCMIRLEKEHTHTHFAWDQEITGEQFKKIRLQYSDFPDTHQHVHLDTFPSDTLYISIPRGVELIIDLKEKS